MADDRGPRLEVHGTSSTDDIPPVARASGHRNLRAWLAGGTFALAGIVLAASWTGADDPRADTDPRGLTGPTVTLEGGGAAILLPQAPEAELPTEDQIADAVRRAPEAFSAHLDGEAVRVVETAPWHDTSGHLIGVALEVVLDRPATIPPGLPTSAPTCEEGGCSVERADGRYSVVLTEAQVVGQRFWLFFDSGRRELAYVLF